MVDINLIGDDQLQYEGEHAEKEFKDTYHSDVDEPAPKHYTGGGHFDDADYPKVISRGGSKKLMYILAVCSVILLFIVGYFYFIIQPGKSKRTITEPPKTITETPIADDTATAFDVEPETSIIPTATLSPGLRDKVLKFHREINTASNIIKAIPSNVNFTIVSYSDGKFLAELLASADTEIDNANSQLQQTLYSAEIRLVSRDNCTILNRQFRRALVNGTVTLTPGAIESSNLQEPVYLNPTELKNRLTSLCQQIGVKVKQFDMGGERSEGEFTGVPIMFKAESQKSSIITFLQQFKNENMNTSCSKISLIEKDPNQANPDITLILNINLYRKI